MPLENDPTAPLDIDQLRNWLESQVFKLRPQDYCEKYPKWPGMVGLEVEMQPTHRASLEDGPRVLSLGGEGGSFEILTSLAKEQGWQIQCNGDGTVKQILVGDEGNITFEPGGQIEFSSIPYPCLKDALVKVRQVQTLLDQAYGDADALILQSGINHWQTPSEIGLQMAKPRYRAMDDYFRKIGPYGERMMRQTMTIQVNLDFGADEETLAKRYLAANLLAPLATLIFASAPYTDGKLQDVDNIRAKSWQHLDPGRTGFPDLTRISENFTRSAVVDTYLDFLLDAGVVFIESQHFRVPNPGVTFRQWLGEGIDGQKPTMQDFLNHTSLHFPEVRPKGFLEIRSVDGQARPWQAVPAAFYCSLLYDPQNTDRVIELMSPHMENLESMWHQSVNGFGRVDWAKTAVKVASLAMEGFLRLPSCFQGEGTEEALLKYFDRFTSRHKAPADELRELSLQQNGLSGVEYLKLVECWENDLG